MLDDMSADVPIASRPPNRVDLTITLSRFHLPPVESALVVGRKAPIGANAMAKALEEMLPNQFRKVTVEHPDIEAVLIRNAHLQRIPEDRLVAMVLKHAERFMGDSEMLHLDIGIQVQVAESIEL